MLAFYFATNQSNFNWLNTQCMQFYWKMGDLGAFSSTWLADWKHFHSIWQFCLNTKFIYLFIYFLYIYIQQNFVFYIFDQISFFFFSNLTCMQVFNFRQIFEGKLYPLTYIPINLCTEIYNMYFSHVCKLFGITRRVSCFFFHFNDIGDMSVFLVLYKQTTEASFVPYI